MGSDFLHNLMKNPLLLAQCCALFPVRGITVNTSHKLRFRWFSFLTLYTFVVWALMFLVLYATWVAEHEDADSTLSLLNAPLLDAVGPPLVFFPSFLYLSCKWRKFVHSWENVERRLPKFEPLRHFDFKLKLIFIVFISTRVGHTLVNTVFFFSRSTECLQLESWWDHIGVFFFVHFRKMWAVTTYSSWKCIGLVLPETLGMLQWLSPSLLITILSLILTARFRVFNNNLEAFKRQLMPSTYWQEMREAYNSLAQLTNLLDSLLSPLIMTTFMLETLIIIIYIYWAIDTVKTPSESVVAGVGCIRVLIVNLISQLSVSAVYEESKRPLSVFSLVPSACYCKEVQRLYEQVATDTLALTGCQFFFVTRSVILTMVSTIVTYEVVLIQFGNYELEPSTRNSTLPAYCDSLVVPAITDNL